MQWMRHDDYDDGDDDDDDDDDVVVEWQGRGWECYVCM
jgi:hypothetical protein